MNPTEFNVMQFLLDLRDERGADSLYDVVVELDDAA